MSPHDLSAGDVLDHIGRLARQAAARYGWPESATVELLNLSENATYLVKREDSCQTVLRVHRLGYHTRVEIESELAWMQALRAEAGVRTPQVLAADDGTTVIALADESAGEERFCTMFEFLPAGSRSSTT